MAASPVFDDVSLIVVASSTVDMCNVGRDCEVALAASREDLTVENALHGECWRVIVPANKTAEIFMANWLD